MTASFESPTLRSILPQLTRSDLAALLFLVGELPLCQWEYLDIAALSEACGMSDRSAYAAMTNLKRLGVIDYSAGNRGLKRFVHVLPFRSRTVEPPLAVRLDTALALVNLDTGLFITVDLVPAPKLESPVSPGESAD